jgi:hypothetical protein
MQYFVVACVLFAIGWSAPAFADKEAAEAAYLSALKNPDDDTILDAYLATLPKVKAPLPGGDPLYVLEGDMLQTRNEVRALLRWKTSKDRAQKDSTQLKDKVRAATDPTELIVNLDVNGDPTFWKASTGPEGRVLRYAVVRSTFPSQETYDKVVADIKSATGDWVAACPECGLAFEHVAEQDKMETIAEFEGLAQTDKLRFIVVHNDTEGQFIAAAFFPNDPVSRRVVQIDPSYFNLTGTGYDGRGVLRHELGHVLGYRHEHIRAEAGCWPEDEQWKPFTVYDSSSVMHYMCGRGGTQTLTISTCDLEGHRKVYAGTEPATCQIRRD